MNYIELDIKGKNHKLKTHLPYRECQEICNMVDGWKIVRWWDAATEDAGFASMLADYGMFEDMLDEIKA